MSVIDAHLHLWQRSEGAYGWLRPEFGALYDDFDAEQASDEMRAAGVDAAILVQADDTQADAEFMFSVAHSHSWVAGVVAWLPLDKPARASELLSQWSTEPTFCGVRQLVHDDPRPNVYRLAEVAETARLLAAAKVPLDIPDAWPRDLPQIVDLAAAHPELSLIIDHLGKPPVDRLELNRWRATLAQLSAAPNVAVKFSGLHHPQRPFTVDTARELWLTALELFGANRVMLGSDWPITITHGGYQPTWAVMAALLAELNPADRLAVQSGTARRVYQRSVRIRELDE